MSQGGWEIVERRGRRGEYGKEIGRRAQFQARLFETLITLSIPWVRIRRRVGERGLPASEVTAVPPIPRLPRVDPNHVTASIADAAL